MIKLLKNLWFLVSLVGLLVVAPCFGAGQDIPRRIVSLGPINTENVFLLGAGDRLVGDTIYCVRPEAARKKTKIGSVMQISIEKIIALQPDIILATALTRTEQVRQLQNLGYRVIRFPQPRSFAEICRQFVGLGKALGVREQAESIVKRARAEVERIKEAVATRPKPKVFLQVGTRPLFGAVPGSFVNDFITLAGGVNIIADQGKGATRLEKVISTNPDVIIIAIMGSETGIAGEEKRMWQRFDILHAVQNERVFIINPDLACSPSPVTFVKTLAMIARMIHPDLMEGTK